MSLSRIMTWATILLAILIISPSFVFATDDIQIRSAIIFNTSCARCHEGECSGRMTFHLPKRSAEQHIHRHGGELSKETSEQLFELLRYMKEECRFYPFSVGLAQDQMWDSDMLSKFRSPSSQAYFLPLGFLVPGLYELQLEGINDKANTCIEIINNEFDYFDKNNINWDNGKVTLQFHADERSEYFLRISNKKPIRLNNIKLIESGQNSIIE